MTETIEARNRTNVLATLTVHLGARSPQSVLLEGLLSGLLLYHTGVPSALKELLVERT